MFPSTPTDLKPVSAPYGRVTYFSSAPGPIRPSSTERGRSRNARPPAPPCEPATGPQAWQLSRHNLIGGADRIITPATQEFMALRSGVKTQVAEGASHMVFVSRPGATAAPSGPGTKPSKERRR
ncbi:alpha/beta fold hydrolase [Streptomyces chartreusis]|uniref:alpha/beta fold hydrolase n=1 Tax=Streptomyces chartreusis TaxID=1969 RepID=UPI00368E8598